MRRTGMAAGFTLIEMMISITIFAVLMAIVLGVYTGLSRAAARSAAVAQLHGEAQGVLEQIRDDFLRMQPQCAAFVDIAGNRRITFMASQPGLLAVDHGQGGGSQHYGSEVMYVHDLVWVRYDWRDQQLRRAMSPPMPTQRASKGGGHYDLLGASSSGDRGSGRNGRGMVFPQREYRYFEPLTPTNPPGVDWPGLVALQSTWPQMVAEAGSDPEAASRLNTLSHDGIWWWSPPLAGNGDLAQQFVAALWSNARMGTSATQSGVPASTWLCESLDGHADNRYFSVRNPNDVTANRDRIQLLGPDPDGDDNEDFFFPSRLALVSDSVVRFELECFAGAPGSLPVGDTQAVALDGRPTDSSIRGYTEPAGRRRVASVRVRFILHSMPMEIEDHQNVDGDASTTEPLARAIGEAGEDAGETLAETAARFDALGYVALVFEETLRLPE